MACPTQRRIQKIKGVRRLVILKTSNKNSLHQCWKLTYANIIIKELWKLKTITTRSSTHLRSDDQESHTCPHLDLSLRDYSLVTSTLHTIEHNQHLILPQDSHKHISSLATHTS